MFNANMFQPSTASGGGGGSGGVTPEEVNQMIAASLVPVNANIQAVNTKATDAQTDAQNAQTAADSATATANQAQVTADTTKQQLSDNQTVTKANTAIQDGVGEGGVSVTKEDVNLIIGIGETTEFVKSVNNKLPDNQGNVNISADDMNTMSIGEINAALIDPLATNDTINKANQAVMDGTDGLTIVTSPVSVTDTIMHSGGAITLFSNLLKTMQEKSSYQSLGIPFIPSGFSPIPIVVNFNLTNITNYSDICNQIQSQVRASTQLPLTNFICEYISTSQTLQLATFNSNITVSTPSGNTYPIAWLLKLNASSNPVFDNTLYIIKTLSASQVKTIAENAQSVASTAVQTITASGNSKATRTGNTVNIDTAQVDPANTDEVPYYNFTGTPNAEIDSEVLSSVSNLLLRDPFPSKTIYIAAQLLPPPVSTYNYKVLVIKTAMDAKQFDNGSAVLLSGAITDTWATVQQALIHASSPNLNITVMNMSTQAVQQFPFNLLANTHTSFSALATFITQQMRTTEATSSIMPNASCTWDSVGQQLVWNTNTNAYRFTYFVNPTQYAANTILKCTLEKGAGTQVGILRAQQFIVNNPNFNTSDVNFASAESYYFLQSPVSTIDVVTSYCSFTIGVDKIWANPSLIDNNRVMLKITSSEYSLVQVGNPNTYPIRRASNINTNGTKKWDASYYILPTGLSLSPQQFVYYNNNEITASGIPQSPPVTLSLDFSNYPYSLTSFAMDYWLIYEDVNPPTTAYILTIAINHGTYYVNDKYANSNLELTVMPQEWTNNRIVKLLSVQCVNNSITVAFKSIPSGVNAPEYLSTGLSGGECLLNNGLHNYFSYIIPLRTIPTNTVNMQAGIQQLGGRTALVISLQPNRQYTIKLSGDFHFTEELPANTVLNFAIKNIANPDEFYSHFISYINQADLEQWYTVSFEVKNRLSDVAEYEVLVYTSPDVPNSSFIIGAYLNIEVLEEKKING